MTSEDGGFAILDRQVGRGERLQLEIPAGRLPSGTLLSLPVEVLCGAERGPIVWLSGAIHGDEIVGVEIIRRVLDQLEPEALRGTLVAAPVVNVFGFVFESRYLPDRRDLNRSFPGSKSGSLAARLARLVLDEVVSPCQFGIDYHAGSDDRTNLPQVRGDMDDPETHRVAMAFGAPAVIHATPRSGTLRRAALRRGKRVLLFEGGEPKRFSPEAVEVGVAGTLRALGALDMIDGAPPSPGPAPFESRSTKWIRAPRGGIFRLETALGGRIRKGERVGQITEPTGPEGSTVKSRTSGLVIGHTVNPLVSLGDGIVHVAERVAPER